MYLGAKPMEEGPSLEHVVKLQPHALKDGPHGGIVREQSHLDNKVSDVNISS